MRLHAVIDWTAGCAQLHVASSTECTGVDVAQRAEAGLGGVTRPSAMDGGRRCRLCRRLPGPSCRRRGACAAPRLHGRAARGLPHTARLLSLRTFTPPSTSCTRTPATSAGAASSFACTQPFAGAGAAIVASFSGACSAFQPVYRRIETDDLWHREFEDRYVCVVTTVEFGTASGDARCRIDDKRDRAIVYARPVCSSFGNINAGPRVVCCYCLCNTGASAARLVVPGDPARSRCARRVPVPSVQVVEVLVRTRTAASVLWKTV